MQIIHGAPILLEERKTVFSVNSKVRKPHNSNYCVLIHQDVCLCRENVKADLLLMIKTYAQIISAWENIG
jgi:hypothetical protein